MLAGRRYRRAPFARPWWSATTEPFFASDGAGPARLGPGEGFAGRVWRTRHPEIVHDIGALSEADYLHRARALAAGLRSMIGIPLAFGPRMLAVVVFNMTRLTPHHEQVVPTVMDIAAHLFSIKRMEEAVLRGNAAAQRLSDLLASAGDAIICVDGHHQIATFNAEADRIFGYAANEVVGRPLDILLPESVRDRHHAHMQSFATASAPRRLMGDRSEIRGRRKDGSEFFAEAAISKLHTADGMLFTAVLRDVTQRRQADEMLRAAVSSAEAANATKSEFLANMSHELRTPLNAIIGFSELMANDHCGPLSPLKIREYARDINASGQHLLRIIGDVLDLAKADAGRAVLHEEAVDLKEVATECARMVGIGADRRADDIDIRIDEGFPSLFADRAKVRQMVLNLLSNSVKFISTERRGKVALAAIVDQAGRAILSVQDDGIGMAPEQVPIALEPFRQIDNRLTRKCEGTGLGLPITKRLAELHGGELDIVSAQGQGTTVRIVFPARRVMLDT